MVKHIVKYNPAFLSDEELIENFVVRHSDLDTMVRILGENVTGSNQHILVVGPRGSGKTTLALRVAAEIRRKKEYKDRWYPLIFSEESYEVVTAGEFWLEALFHLCEQTGDDRWKVTYAELKKERDEQRLAERALAQLLDFADGQGKRILLIVENINMLFGSQISEEEAWKMRHTLINESRLMLLATAANRFEQFENASHAMFEMFKLHELKRLEDEECNTIWELVAGKKLLGERIRPIRILTGGNPRLLTIIARFSAHRSFGKLLDDLVDLIDDHTEYFKSHLDNLPAIERKVYLSLAELWDPSTARDIAAAARLGVNPTSSLLKRLVGRGAVIVESQGKKARYMVAERMYNIYYLMRRRGKPADRVQATVKFMSAMYDPEGTARLIVEEASKLSPERCRDYYVAYSEVIKGIPDQDRRERIIHCTPKTFLEQAEETFLRAIQIDPEKAAAHVGLINVLAVRSDRHAIALQKAEEIIDRRPDDSWLLNEVAWIFYERRLLPFMPQAEKWARRAVEISPKDLCAQHTLACILCVVGKGSEALEHAGRYVQNAALVERSIEDTIALFVELAACGFAKESLGLLRNSPSEKFLEPLVAGLRLFVGEDVTTAVEIWEVAKDVVQRIEDRRRS